MEVCVKPLEISREDIEALRYLKFFAEEAHEAAAYMKGMDVAHAQMSQRAVVVLDKLLRHLDSEETSE